MEEPGASPGAAESHSPMRGWHQPFLHSSRQATSSCYGFGLSSQRETYINLAVNTENYDFP